MAYEGISVKLFSWSSVPCAAASRSTGWRLSAMRLILSSRRCRLLRAVTVFRPDRLRMLVEPVDHLDQRGGRLELATPDRLADDPHGGHQAFELQMRVVDATVDHALIENFRDDLPDPLGAE